MPMTRRQFGGGVAAALGALLLPKIRLQPHYDLQAMLAPWCAHKLFARYKLTAPYAMDGHAYATDARAMARILDDGLIVDGSARIPRETVSVWDSFWIDDGPWQPWPRQPVLMTSGEYGCVLCSHANVECPECCGLGESCVLPGDRSQRCEACGGDGYQRRPECPLCHGRRHANTPTCAVMGDKLVGLQYMDIVARVPEVRWHAGGQVDGPILWRSDIGIAGMIMPMTRP